MQPDTAPGPYAIGSDTWPGLALLAAECAAAVQAAAAIIACGGEIPPPWWQAPDLRERLENEIADVRAAAAFLAEASGLDEARMAARTTRRLAGFRERHAEHAEAGDGHAA